MKYTSGNTGRVFVARFDHNEKFLTSLEELVKKENIRAGVIHLLGAIDEGDVVTGPKEHKIPTDSKWIHLDEVHELIGLGSIYWEDENPIIHIHSSIGCENQTKVGCLRKNASVFIVIEAVIFEIVNCNVVRTFDPATGYALVDPQE